MKMLELKIFEELKEAYETTTIKCNRFLEKILSIKWEENFYTDGEYYFRYGDMTFTAQSLNPFDEKWKPSAIFADGSFIEF